MSRSGYYDDIENWDLICWRGQVASAIKGKKGQLFLLEMLAALDALSEKKLVVGKLELEGSVCAIGAVGKRRGIDMSNISPEDFNEVAEKFGIVRQLAQEIVYENDEASHFEETPEDRFKRMRAWVVNNIRDFEVK